MRADAQQATFNLAWSGAALGNSATANGTITIDESHFLNPDFNDTTGIASGAPSGTPWVTALSITVVGASSGNGTFGLSDFSEETPDTPGGGFDLTKPLIGQPTTGAGFGTTHDGSSGDFNLFTDADHSNAPVGTFYFQLSAGGPNGQRMYLTQFAPASAPPPVRDVITFDNLSNEPGRASVLSSTQMEETALTASRSPRTPLSSATRKRSARPTTPTSCLPRGITPSYPVFSRPRR